jgi:hypothetical protein
MSRYYRQEIMTSESDLLKATVFSDGMLWINGLGICTSEYALNVLEDLEKEIMRLRKAISTVILTDQSNIREVTKV